MKNTKSILREIESNINWNIDDIDTLKNKCISGIKDMNIFEYNKQKMVYNIQSINDRTKLAQYFYNSLLKFEGHGI
jgi:hypothetical protein